VHAVQDVTQRSLPDERGWGWERSKAGGMGRASIITTRSTLQMWNPTVGQEPLQHVIQPVQDHRRTYPAFDFFSPDEQPMFLALLRGEFRIRGFANKNMRRDLPGKTSSQKLPVRQKASLARDGAQGSEILPVPTQPVRSDGEILPK